MSGLSLKENIWETIDKQKDRFVKICAEMIRCPTENPPGHTTAAVDYLKKYFDTHRLPYDVHEPRPGFQSITSFMEGNGDQTLILNGHLDVFPVGDVAQWTDDPFSGLVKNGRIYGRGSSDMKGGTAASLITYTLFHELNIQPKGKLGLMLVADEETGGQWGTDWILDHDSRFVGDAVLIGEPSGGAVRFGQKGKVWLKLIVQGEPYHGGLGMGQGPIEEMTKALTIVSNLFNIKGKIPEGIRQEIEKSKQFVWIDEFADRGCLLDSVSTSVGYINAGLNVNVVPRRCEAGVDIRLPLGIKPEEILNYLRSEFKKAGLNVEMEPMLHRFCEAAYTPPDDRLIKIACKNVKEVTNEEPPLVFQPTGNDAILFMRRGVAATLYGPRPYNMAAADEYITLRDFVNTLKVHAGIAYDYIA